MADSAQEIVVTDIKIPFISMVVETGSPIRRPLVKGRRKQAQSVELRNPFQVLHPHCKALFCYAPCFSFPLVSELIRTSHPSGSRPAAERF